MSVPEQPSRLLSLPVELQLSIYELVVIEDDVLLLNCGCDSSYRGRRSEWSMNRNLWTEGIKHAPMQPALTKTCKTIRRLTLPMFYKENTFRAHYRWSSDFDSVVDWLVKIGNTNRKLLEKLFLYDRNKLQDRNSPNNIAEAKLKLKETFDAHAEPVMAKDCSCYHVSFDKGDDAIVSGLDRLLSDEREIWS